MKQQDTKKDEGCKFKELVKRMKLFNELLSDYLDAIDMEEFDNADKDMSKKAGKDMDEEED